MKKSLYQAAAMTGLLFLMTIPLTVPIILFLTGMSTDGGEKGTIYFSGLLLCLYASVILSSAIIFKYTLHQHRTVKATVLLLISLGYLVPLYGLLIIPIFLTVVLGYLLANRIEKFKPKFVRFLAVGPAAGLVIYFLMTALSLL